MQLSKVYLYRISLLMFSVKVNTAPLVLRDLFKENSYFHQHSTRQADMFHIPSVKSNYMKRCIHFKGPMVWNSVSKSVSSNCSFISFKIALRSYLLSSSATT